MLLLFLDCCRQCETRLLELLNMKGKHKHKWDYLREVLAERIVYDDNLPRLWYADPSARGLLFSCKQAQVNLDKPAGVVQRVMSGQTGRIQVRGAERSVALLLLRTLNRMSTYYFHACHSAWLYMSHLPVLADHPQLLQKEQASHSCFNPSCPTLARVLCISPY